MAFAYRFVCGIKFRIFLKEGDNPENQYVWQGLFPDNLLRV